MKQLYFGMLMIILLVLSGSTTAYAHHKGGEADLIQVETLIQELNNMPDEQQTMLSDEWYASSGLLAPIGSLEKTEVTLLTFLGLLAILTLRVFFHMYEKNKREMRNARAIEMKSLSHDRSRNATHWNVHKPTHKKVRRSRNHATMSFEQMHCSMLYDRQPRRTKRCRA